MNNLQKNFLNKFHNILEKLYKLVTRKIFNLTSSEITKKNIWIKLSSSRDIQFNFLDIGFYPSFEYRIEQYFNTKSLFYGIDSTDETQNYKKKNNEIVLKKKIVSKNFNPSFKSSFNATSVCNLTNDTINPSAHERRNNLNDFKNVNQINLDLYFEKKKIDFIKSDIDGKDMIVLKDFENKFKNKEILGILIEANNSIGDGINSFGEVYNFLNKFGYRLFDQSNLRALRPVARNHEYRKIYKGSEHVNSEKGQIVMSDMLFFLDPVENYNNLSNDQIVKLISLLDCYDLHDVALEALENHPEIIEEKKLKLEIKKILIEKIKSEYKNYNPLNLKEIYLNGSINSSNE